MSKTLTDEARKLLALIHDLQLEGRPGVLPEPPYTPTGRRVEFYEVPHFVLRAELWPIHTSGDRNAYDAAIAELSTLNLITRSPHCAAKLCAYERPDSVPVVIVPHGKRGFAVYLGRATGKPHLIAVGANRKDALASYRIAVTPGAALDSDESDRFRRPSDAPFCNRVTGAALRKAAGQGKTRRRRVGGGGKQARWAYSVLDAAKLWPGDILTRKA